jgi:hypothetical protein
MLDFNPVRQKKMTLSQLCSDLDPDDLRRLTNEMVDNMLELIADCDDRDVTFVPEDPKADDPAAATEEEIGMAWTLGHVIVHATASAEESAFIAAELARGVPARKGRSRSEVPWQTVHTLAQCRHRLEESRRMRLASLDLWPDQPHLDNTHRPNDRYEPLNAITRFVLGLRHDDSHLDQIGEIVHQARTQFSRFAVSNQ